jgi:hypothetical protein
MADLKLDLRICDASYERLNPRLTTPIAWLDAFAASPIAQLYYYHNEGWFDTLRELLISRWLQTDDGINCVADVFDDGGSWFGGVVSHIYGLRYSFARGNYLPGYQHVDKVIENFTKVAKDLDKRTHAYIERESDPDVPNADSFVTYPPNGITYNGVAWSRVGWGKYLEFTTIEDLVFLMQNDKILLLLNSKYDRVRNILTLMIKMGRALKNDERGENELLEYQLSQLHEQLHYLLPEFEHGDHLGFNLLGSETVTDLEGMTKWLNQPVKYHKRKEKKAQ